MKSIIHQDVTTTIEFLLLLRIEDRPSEWATICVETECSGDGIGRIQKETAVHSYIRFGRCCL